MSVVFITGKCRDGLHDECNANRFTIPCDCPCHDPKRCQFEYHFETLPTRRCMLTSVIELFTEEGPVLLCRTHLNDAIRLGHAWASCGDSLRTEE